MKTSFGSMMADATQLTRAGDLRAAMATIQAALRGAPAPADIDAEVIDVEAHEVDIESVVPPPRDRSDDAGRFIAGHYHHAAGSRDYKLYVPPGYTGKPLALVVMLHGCTQDPDDFARGTRMNEAACERDFLVLYPAQAQRANASRCWNWFKHNHQRRGGGEPALLAAMTRDVMNRYGIDPRRVYVAGLSAGGAMATILGDAYPELFAAVGVHSGLPTGAASNATAAFDAMKRGAQEPVTPTGAVPPVIVFHGDQDTTVHPINGHHIVAAHARATVPEHERLRSENGREYTRARYRDAGGHVMAEHWTVHGQGHAWSGGSPNGSYTDSKGPDATEEMLRFFFAHASTRV
jgi:poly(hydroxyalkanoate) depolymerase family esterase